MLLRFLAAVVLATVAAAAQLVGLPPKPELTPEGRALLHEFEVGGGRGYYERFLARPTWPGFASGVTIGIGYDLGYNSQAVIRQDWRKFAARDRLVMAAGLTGASAKSRIAELRDLVIQWGLAEEVFEEVTVAKFFAMCQRKFPGFDELHPNAQAALLSLVFNRGDSMAGPRREEMREIQKLVPRRDYVGIALELRKMKRIWRGTNIEAGMVRRREAEACLLEKNR
jgi:GH24 family phage-related lysozyme (muramidase)